MSEVGMGWLGRWLLPHEPAPGPDLAGSAEQDRALREAEAAASEFEAVKRRARAMGIEVDVARSWGPRDDCVGR